MALTVDKIIAKFPVKSVPHIEGEPNYESISDMVQILYANAASLPTTLGGGQHGHIGLVMNDILYATLSITPYIHPVNPGQLPILAGTAAQRDEQLRNFEERQRVYNNHNNMDDALKGLIIDAINDPYICELRNKYTGYLGVTTRDLLDHLLDRYGKITPADIETCKKRMNEPIDISQPIDVYFHKVDDCIQYAADGKVAFTPEQIMQTTYHAISTAGMYNDACREWRKKPTAEKTWDNFKTFIAAEYHDLKELQRHGGGTPNFHGAHNVVDITQALDNLALAATTDRDIVNKLTTANQQLVTTIKNLTDQLKQALENNTKLIAALGQTGSTHLGTPATNNTPGARKVFSKTEWEANLDPNGYCWTHGYRVQNGHNSHNCKGKLKDHNDEATRNNNMGGSQKGKDK